MRIELESPRQQEIEEMFRQSNALMEKLYPAESNHMLSTDELARDNVKFLICRLENRAVGCGSVVVNQDYCEIKRMFVLPECRGMQIGKKILAALESEAKKTGHRCIRLETGTLQPEAIGLYRRSGFVEIPAFGDYRPDPLSLFMEKRL